MVEIKFRSNSKNVSFGELVLPDQSYLVRFGGEYEDGGQQNVGSNFVKLIQTVVVNSV